MPLYYSSVSQDYTTRIDEVSSTVTYIGKAFAGTLPAEPLWRVYRITVSGDETIIEYADGDTSLDNIWDDRLTLTYE